MIESKSDLDIFDKVKKKLTPELVNMITKCIVLPDNLEIIRKQKERKSLMHKELLHKIFIREIKNFLLLNILYNIYGNNNNNDDDDNNNQELMININDIDISEDGHLIVNFNYY